MGKPATQWWLDTGGVSQEADTRAGPYRNGAAAGLPPSSVTLSLSTTLRRRFGVASVPHANCPCARRHAMLNPSGMTAPDHPVAQTRHHGSLVAAIGPLARRRDLA
jgi:hypothetical protein